MKTLTHITLAVVLTTRSLQATPLPELLEQAVHLQDIEQNHPAAIETLQSLIAKSDESYDLTAEAHLRLAQSYLAIGERDSAAAQVDLLNQIFPADNEFVLAARDLQLNAIDFLPAPWNPEGESTTGGVFLPDGTRVGSFFSAIEPTFVDGVPAWQSWFARDGGMNSFSTGIFTQDGFEALSASSKFDGLPRYDFTFQKEGAVNVLKVGADEEPTIVEPPAGSNRLFENDMTIPIMRTLPFEIGKVITLPVYHPITPVPFEFTLTPVEEVDVKVPAGTFNCIKVESNINQTFYMSTDADRHMVRIEAGGARIDLETITTFSSEQPTKKTFEDLVESITLPKGTRVSNETAKEEIVRLHFDSLDLSFSKGLLQLNTRKFLGDSGTDIDAFEEFIIKNQSSLYEELMPIKESYQKVRSGRLKGIAFLSKVKKGDLENLLYTAVLLDKEHGVALRADLLEQDEEKVRAFMDQVLDGIEFK